MKPFSTIENGFREPRVCMVLILCFLLFPIASAEAATEKYTVRKEGGSLTVSVNGAPVERVFTDIKEAFGIHVKVFPEMEQKKITAKFNRVRLPEAVRMLVGENYVLQFKGNEVSGIYILNRGQDYTGRNRLIEKYTRREPLSLDELKQAILNNVRKKAPTASLVATYPHADLNGNPESYAFSVYTGQGEPPTEGRLKALFDAYWKQGKQGGTGDETAAALRNELKNMSKGLVTVEASATYDSPPVKAFYGGLPQDITMHPRAQELAEGSAKGDHVSFIRTFRMTPLGIGFIFEGEGKKTCYVDVLNGKVYRGWTERDSAGKRTTGAQEQAERVERIGEQWEEFLF